MDETQERLSDEEVSLIFKMGCEDGIEIDKLQV
jgi:hypothetical protein